MSELMRFWVIIIVLAIGTFLLRSVPIWMHGRVPVPHWLERLLKHVPAAALTTLVVPGALYVKANGSYEFAPERTVAAVAALLVAMRTKSMIATLVVGMGALWIMQALLG